MVRANAFCETAFTDFDNYHRMVLLLKLFSLTLTYVLLVQIITKLMQLCFDLYGAHHRVALVLQIGRIKLCKNQLRRFKHFMSNGAISFCTVLQK